MRVRIAIAGEHTLIRRGVLSMIMNMSVTPHHSMTPVKFSVVGDSALPSDILELLSQKKIDILFLGFSQTTDISTNPLKGMDGIRLIKWLSQKYPEVKIVVLSPYKNTQLVRLALELGVKAYISRDTCEKTLQRMLTAVINDEVYIERELMNSLFCNDNIRSPELSPREIDVLRMLCKGLNLMEIATQLHLSNKTVSAHKIRAMDKLGVNSDCQLYCLIAKTQMFDIII